MISRRTVAYSRNWSRISPECGGAIRKLLRSIDLIHFGIFTARRPDDFNVISDLVFAAR